MARRYRPRPGQSGPGKKRRPPKVKPAVHQVPDTPMAKAEEQTRLEIQRLIVARSKDLGLDETQRTLARVVDQHPEHAPDFLSASDWLSDGNVDSPFLHVALHRMVEERVVTGEMARLRSDIPWVDAVHEATEELCKELGLTPVQA